MGQKKMQVIKGNRKKGDKNIFFNMPAEIILLPAQLCLN
jgi:hypothetical protein